MWATDGQRVGKCHGKTGQVGIPPEGDAHCTAHTQEKECFCFGGSDMKTRNRLTPWTEGGKLVGLRFGGQPYRFVGLRPHQRRDGSMTELSVWSSTCPDCRQAIEVTSPVLSREFSPSRRCGECAAPGRKVQAR